ncbi:hypothetical protein HanIR_Chr12g0613251 [Helianthus annuus]|nr:hypothetical protein HanIR_Chr12g0613251 [Helianthus annuus]
MCFWKATDQIQNFGKQQRPYFTPKKSSFSSKIILTSYLPYTIYSIYLVRPYKNRKRQ